MECPRHALRARQVLPICGPPIADGVVVVEGTQIVSVGTDSGGAPVCDLGETILLPGFVNAHTHLEFSDLRQPLGTSGMILPQWIRSVVEHRRASATNVVAAIADGLSQCLAAGTTTVGEIATTDWRGAASLPDRRPETVLFFELIGPTLLRAQTAGAAAEAFISSATVLDNVTAGLSPHAPYTVHPRLLEVLVDLSRRYRAPLSMHLAESREELELLNLGSGPFREMLETLGAWDSADDARLHCILEYLAALARADRALVIHGNYLDDEEIAFLADHASTMSVVYCPRTHRYFDHEPYPLAKMLEAGITIALGTDSRASNPDLSLLEEARHAAASHPAVAPARILELATLGGASALGLAHKIGTLEAGKRANLVAVRVADLNPRSELAEQLLANDARVVGTWVGGERVERFAS